MSQSWEFEGLAFLSPCLHRLICVALLLELFLGLWHPQGYAELVLLLETLGTDGLQGER